MDAEEETTGRRSPQWAFMSRLRIMKPEVGLYLDRLRIVATPRFGVYLHHIVQPDQDPDPHDHPWPFATVVLRGGYVEEFHSFPYVFGSRQPKNQVWRRWSCHRMGTETAHRITRLLGDTWTLVFVGRRRGTWGFWRGDAWLSWDEYEEVTR